MEEIRVRKSVKGDLRDIADRMRNADKKEIWASNNIAPLEALIKGLDNSVYCRTVENGRAILMFGVAPEDILGNRAAVWMLSTDDLDNIKIHFLRNCRKYVDEMLEYYEYLENYVDCENTKCIQWLKFLGANIDEPAPYGVEGKLFRHFSFTKGKDNV